MKTTLRKLLAPAVLMLMMLAMSVSAYAALTAPTLVKIEAGENSVTLTYSPVSGADGYAVFMVHPETGEKLIAEPINKNKMSELKDSATVTVSNLANGTSYGFKVAAVSNGEIGDLSNKMTATPAVINPGPMVNARVSSNGNKSVTLAWTALTNASGYYVYQKNSKGKYKKIATVNDGTAEAFTVTGLKNNKKYYFKLAAFRTVDGQTVVGSKSAKLKGAPQNVSVSAKQVHAYYYKVKLTEAATAKEVNGSGTLSLKKGTTIKVYKRVKGYTGTSYFKYKGTKYKISSKVLDYDKYKFVTSSKPYSDTVATEFVNYKGYKSGTKYLIWINTYTQRLYIFKGSQYKWVLQKKMKCSTGMAGTYTDFEDSTKILRAETPLGSSKLSGKQPEWKFAWDQYAFYASRIKGGAIHSELYYPDTMQKWSLGKLGKPASHGCVRVEITNAKFIYDDIPVGTKVVVY